MIDITKLENEHKSTETKDAIRDLIDIIRVSDINMLKKNEQFLKFYTGK